MAKKTKGMKDSRFSKKEKLEKVIAICEHECPLIYMEKDIEVSFDHYSDEVHTVFLREDPETKVRVTHEDVKHIAERIRTEVSERWHVGLVVSRPELFSYDVG